jgi:hypothetical protein
MKMHRNQALTSKTLVMDGAQFIDCTLNNCKLKYNGGIVVLKGTSVNNCTWEFAGPALNTIELLTTLGALRSSVSETWSVAPSTARHGY